MLYINDPDVIEYTLKTNFQNYEKGKLFREIFYDFLGEGIFNSDGVNWKQQRYFLSLIEIRRATASHLFSIHELKAMVQVFHRHGESVLEYLNAHEGQTIDAQDLFQRYTLDSFGEIALGENLDSLHSAGIDIYLIM